MLCLRNKICYTYTIQPVIEFKKLNNLKVCYRKDLDFLKYKLSLTNSLSNRIVHKGNYLRSYKNLREYYTYLLRANFQPKLCAKYAPYIFSGVNNKKFLLIYFQQQSIKNFDFLLYWRGCQTNSLFNIKTTITKKKKKKIL